MINQSTKFNVKPSIDVQLLGVSKDCLILQHCGLKLRLSFGWTGVWLFWVLGLPMLMYLIVAPWLPPYGFREGVEIASFHEKLSGYPILGIAGKLIFSIILGAPGIAMSLGFAFINLKRISTDYSPIVFDRKTKSVSTYNNNSRVKVDWADLEGSIRTVFYASGFVPQQMRVLCFVNLGENTLIEGGIRAESLDGDSGDSVEAIWEFIRQFMDEGPDKLSIHAIGFKGFNNLDKQPFYSYAFLDSLSTHWIWPIFKTSDRHPLTVFLTLLFLPIKVLFFIPNILADWLWRKISLNRLSESFATPHYVLNQYEGLITSKDAIACLQAGEDSFDGVNYIEIKRRMKSS